MVRGFEKRDDAVDPLLLRYLTCEGRDPIEPTPESYLRVPNGKWLQKGRLPDGRHWAIDLLLWNCARLQVWSDESMPGTSDDVWDYCNETVATLAVLEWEGVGDEPKWWLRHTKTGRRRYYQLDGSWREELRL